MHSRLAVCVTLLLFLPSVSALQVAETDFLVGSYFHTSSVSGSLQLGSDAQGFFFLGGNFSSQVLSSGGIVRWTNISWTSQVGAGEAVKLQVRFGNSSVPDDSWSVYSANMSTAQALTGMTQYVQFMALLETSANTTPFVQEVNISYDLLPLNVQLVSPTHNTVTSNPNVTFTCLATSSYTVKNITLFTTIPGVWTANATLQTNASSATASFSFSNIADGTYVWNCKADDGTTTFASQNNTIVVAATNSPPVILNTKISPSLAAPNDTIYLGINATDTIGIDDVWATLTSPNNTMLTVMLVNNNVVPISLLDIGTYLVSFFANDTTGTAVNVQQSLVIAAPGTFNGSIQNTSGNITADVTIYQGYATTSQETGSYTIPILQAPLDLAVSVFGGDFVVRLNGIPATEMGKTLLLDKTAVDSYPLVFAVINPYTISSGEITLRYPDAGFTNDAVSLYICANWNFTSRSCAGSYTQASGFFLDAATNTIRLNVTSFSGFAIKQEGFCGDGICSSGENATDCSADCECVDGTTQGCGSLSIGECKAGSQTCIQGHWGVCTGEVPPSTEKCNRKDDDCDGITDNVNGGTLLEETQCRCFIGSPTQEVCNGIDDDCDGQVDGFSKACGSNIGTCKEGTQICTQGVFGICSGGVSPREEVCDNGLDDNCNADNDEDCPTCTDGVQNGIEQGVDCGGSCPTACGSPIVLLLPAIAVIVLLVAVYYLKFRKTSWSSLEKKYSYSTSS